VLRNEEIWIIQWDLERRRKLMEAQFAALQSEFAAKEEEVKQLVAQYKIREKVLAEGRKEMGHMRKEDKK